MPVRDLLVLVRNIQQAAFLEIITDNVQTGRHAIRHPGRNRHGRQTGQVDRDGVDVLQVHAYRVIRFLAEPEGRRRCRRPHDDIHLLKCLEEILADQASHLLRL